jgi:hypothetical protein
MIPRPKNAKKRRRETHATAVGSLAMSRSIQGLYLMVTVTVCANGRPARPKPENAGPVPANPSVTATLFVVRIKYSGVRQER